MTTTHSLLILSGRAEDYAGLIRAAGLPGLMLTAAATTAAGLPPAAFTSDMLLGDPALIQPVLPALPALRWVQSTWAGVEKLLFPPARTDYLLTNVRDVFGRPMAEYTFAYLLMHEQRGWTRYANQQAQRWSPAIPGSLAGKVIGLLGVGSIGAHIAGTAKHFGMMTRGYTRHSADCAAIDHYFHGEAGWPAFLRGLDYLVCSLPATPESRHMLNAAAFAALSPQTLLVNVGRGSLIDEPALLAALDAGQLAGAVLDVFATEPLPAGHPFWTHPRVWLTPHVAAFSRPADIAPIFVANYRRFIAGEPLLHQVDFAAGY